MPNRRAPFIFALLVIASILHSAPVPSKELVAPTPIITLKAGGHSIRAEVVATDEARQKGLMFRETLAKDAGMLFVFPDIAYHAMWMRNTPLPLAVAFIDEHGKIVSVHEMQPFTDITHQAAGPVRYALEMNADWFTRNQVKVGDSVKGLEKAPKPR